MMMMMMATMMMATMMMATMMMIQGAGLMNWMGLLWCVLAAPLLALLQAQ